MRSHIIAMAVGAALVALTLRFSPIKELAPDQYAGLTALLFIALAGVVHAIRGKAAQ